MQTPNQIHRQRDDVQPDADALLQVGGLPLLSPLPLLLPRWCILAAAAAAAGDGGVLLVGGRA